MNKTVLIFPAGMPMALAFLKRAQLESYAVIGASSLAHDPVRTEYPAWLHLPYIHHEGFDTALAQAIHTFAITDVYCSHPVVWDHLQRVLKVLAPGVSLLNASPVHSELEVFRGAQRRAQDVSERPLPLASATAAQPDWSALQIASLYRHVDGIPGMCDHEKLRALYEVARHCPAGDVVEIGSWWGKSAFVLLRLARDFGIGNLLCVDPWSDEGLVSEGAHSMVASTFSAVSAQEAFNVFLLNLLPYASGNINFLRMPSLQGSAVYRERTPIRTPELGTVDYRGQIAMLHIDGNHSYDNARADMESWGSMVMSGGWIVLDDYTWPFGDGPQRVGDEFLKAQGDSIATAFVMGGALFIQMA